MVVTEGLKINPNFGPIPMFITGSPGGPETIRQAFDFPLLTLPAGQFCKLEVIYKWNENARAYLFYHAIVVSNGDTCPIDTPEPDSGHYRSEDYFLGSNFN
jgi:hypothetical protein